MTILVATDGSRGADAAVRFAARLASSCRSGSVVILTVSTLRNDFRLSFPKAFRSLLPYRELARVERDALHRILEDARRRAGSHAARSRVRLLDPVKPQSAVDAILQEAERQHADLIVVGSEGRSALAGWALGSVAQALVSRSRRPVAVVHPPRMRKRPAG